MFETRDDSCFTEFEQVEIKQPCPRKEDADGRFIYVSRELGLPKQWGAPILCDFGSAVILGNEAHAESTFNQTFTVHQKSFWRFSGHTTLTFGIWVAWSGISIKEGTSSPAQTRNTTPIAVEPTWRRSSHSLAHRLPVFCLKGTQVTIFFSDSGQFSAEIPLPVRIPLGDRVSGLEGEDKQLFLKLMLKILQWEPHKRAPPSELADDEWIRRQL
ncbi:unnamed protein product [Discula destructiva]